MAVTLQSTQSATSTNGTSITITKPTSLAVGDLMLITLIWSFGAVTKPAGYTLIKSYNFASSYYIEYWWKIADSTDVAATNFTYSTTSSAIAGSISRITGHDSNNPVGAVSNGQRGGNNTNQTIFTSSSITPPPNCLLCAAFFGENNQPVDTYEIANSNPTWAEQWELFVSGNRHILAISSVRNAATATGNFTITYSGTAQFNLLLVAIQPPVPIVPSGFFQFFK